MTTEAPPDALLLTVGDVARMTQVAPGTVYQLAAEGRIPGVFRVGRRVRFQRAAVLAWLASDQQRGSRPKRTR